MVRYLRFFGTKKSRIGGYRNGREHTVYMYVLLVTEKVGKKYIVTVKTKNKEEIKNSTRHYIHCLSDLVGHIFRKGWSDVRFRMRFPATNGIFRGGILLVCRSETGILEILFENRRTLWRQIGRKSTYCIPSPERWAVTRTLQENIL